MLAYQYLPVLPKIAEGSGSQVWMIPSELSKALEGLRRRKVLNEHCRLRSVGCALEEPPVRASEGRRGLDLKPGR